MSISIRTLLSALACGLLAACAAPAVRHEAPAPQAAGHPSERETAMRLERLFSEVVMSPEAFQTLLANAPVGEDRLARILYWSQAYPTMPHLQSACLIKAGDMYNVRQPGLANDYYQMVSQSVTPGLEAYRALALARLTALAGRQAVHDHETRLQARCNSDSVHVRAGPSVQAQTVATVGRGRSFLVAEISSAPATVGTQTAYWYKIESASATQGWVFGRYLDLYRHLSVDAKSGWVDSGVDVLPNQQVLIEQTGGLWSVNTDEYKPVDTNGFIHEESMPLWGIRERKYLWGVPFAALVGAVGDQGSPFYIGRHGDFVPSRPGRLFLRINEKDEFLDDNQGSVSVSIKTKNQTQP